ncbi:MAG: DUF3187 family protein [Treponema sp.]|nr:DUF3187 family protein [Treponema sp.]
MDDQGADYAKGPLYGKNMFLPYLIHYHLPALQARSGEQFDFQYHWSAYYVQDVQYIENVPLPPTGERYYKKVNIIRDYESFAIELGFSFQLLEELQIGLDMRLLSYYGGFLDPLFEEFHSIFGLPNAGREFFLQNQLYINIPSDNGVLLFLDESVTAFGDIDIWGKWTFFENDSISLAALGGFKLPTGRLETLSGSGYPDLGLGIIADIRPLWYLSIYGQAGLTLPFNGKSYPMFNGYVGLEIHPWDIFSFSIQMNIKTSPISNDIGWGWNWDFNTNFKAYSMPQINILVGFMVRSGDFTWQCYLEEDAITNQGADLSFNLMFSQRIRPQGRENR